MKVIEYRKILLTSDFPMKVCYVRRVRGRNERNESFPIFSKNGSFI